MNIFNFNGLKTSLHYSLCRFSALTICFLDEKQQAAKNCGLLLTNYNPMNIFKFVSRLFMQEMLSFPPLINFHDTNMQRPNALNKDKISSL